MVKPLHTTDLSYFAGKRCLITGHTGFKGSWLTILLHQCGAQVYGYALEPPSTPALFDIANLSSLLKKDIRADIRDREKLQHSIAQTSPEIIIHMAAQSLVRESYRTPYSTLDTNVVGTMNLLEVVRQRGKPCTLLTVTSDKCYELDRGNHYYQESDKLGGHDPYSCSKAMAELVSSCYARSFGEGNSIHFLSARAGNVIGGGDWAADRLIPDIVRAGDASQTVDIRQPDAVRPWQHVLEPLSGYLALVKYFASGQDTIEIGNGPSTRAFNFAPPKESCQSVATVVDQFINQLGKGEWRDLSENSNQEYHEAGLLMLDNSKAKRQLGWQPRWSLAETIENTARWYREYGAGSTDPIGLCHRDIEHYFGAHGVNAAS